MEIQKVYADHPYYDTTPYYITGSIEISPGIIKTMYLTKALICYDTCREYFATYNEAKGVLEQYYRLKDPFYIDDSEFV